LSIDTARRMCRNPRCRSKLPTPVENIYSAFCAKGCFNQFFRHRCLVCEREMVRKTEAQQLCGKPRCNSAFKTLKAHFALGKYHPSTSAVSEARNPHEMGTSLRPLGDRTRDQGWRQIAGPRLTDRDLRLVVVGAEDAVKAADRANRKFWRDAGESALFQNDVLPVSLVGGLRGPYRHRETGVPLPGQPPFDLMPGAPSIVSVPISVPFDPADPLAIPDFLRRPMPEAAQ
jgi:hypothetical protein